MPRQLTWEQAIDRVLADAEGPLHYMEITERIISRGLRTSLGATPAATVASVLSTSISREDARHPWCRVGRGTYAPATSNETRTTDSSARAVEDSLDQGEQYAVISSFGMFWSREAVEWTRNPRLVGKQFGGSIEVDFSSQTGVYLLYDGREVIYVGRAIERGLGVRLSEHTWDRLASRWDRFSWFGLRPVAGDGVLLELPQSVEMAKLGPALEAILVEALEPRQNRKRGDDLAQVEYLQVVDPEVRRRLLRAAFDEAIR